jgi:hypothetical protein
MKKIINVLYYWIINIFDVYYKLCTYKFFIIKNRRSDWDETDGSVKYLEKIIVLLYIHFFVTSPTILFAHQHINI